jgi:hypothetical protein
MLKQTKAHLKSHGIEPIVLHDGITFPFRGKKGFWQTWDEVLKECEKNPSDMYLFMPEDFEGIDIERIKQIHQEFKRNPYVYNIVNDGRHECWLRFQRQQPKNGHEEVGYCDGGFFCNREALKLTKWRIKQPPESRWNNPNMSSGVGMQLTHAFKNGRVKMYKPVESLAYHGDHESQMHKNERQRNPLISK